FSRRARAQIRHQRQCQPVKFLFLAENRSSHGVCDSTLTAATIRRKPGRRPHSKSFERYRRQDRQPTEAWDSSRQGGVTLVSSATMKQDTSYFDGHEPILIYIARRLKDALRLESIFTAAGIHYGVEADEYRGGVIFFRTRVGAFFYV